MRKFSELVAELESDPAMKDRLIEARKWVAQHFYEPGSEQYERLMCGEGRTTPETRPAHTAAHDCACKDCVAAETAVARIPALPISADDEAIVDAVCKRAAHLAHVPTVPNGHFWRGVPESNRHQCRNCGEHYDKHLHTDEASRCPETSGGRDVQG